jgi:hypothetical protein
MYCDSIIRQSPVKGRIYAGYFLHKNVARRLRFIFQISKWLAQIAHQEGSSFRRAKSQESIADLKNVLFPRAAVKCTSQMAITPQSMDEMLSRA